MQVLKALSAMRLTKEDPIPSLILSTDSKSGQLTFAQEDSTPFLYQGSVGAAFNKEKLDELGITHILTAAANIGQRFPDHYKYF